MKQKNNNPTRTIIGDKRTHGSRNIPLFWNSKRYFKENLFHAIATSLMILLLVLLVIYIILMNTAWRNAQLTTLLWITAPSFICVFGTVILKLAERKIKKQRIYDLAGSEGRKIESNLD
jgi:asparagine N-glycosylation enzyme membrane subunit Stt3